MKKFFNGVFLIAVILCAGNLNSQEAIDIGEETVQPIYYPTFFMSGFLNFKRHFQVQGDKSSEFTFSKLKYGTGFGFEAGLLRYLNAGFTLDFDIPNMKKMESLPVRLSLYAKPFVGIGDRFAIFTRLGGGFGFAILDGIDYLTFNDGLKGVKNESARKKRYQDKYGLHMGHIGGLFTGSATLGLTYFPFSRIGLSVEGGIRGEFITFNRFDKVGVAGGSGFKEKRENFIRYDFPVMLSINAVL